MDSKKLIGLLLTIGGAVALAYGVFALTGGEIGNGQAWGSTILGAVFFMAGIGLMKTVKSAPASGGNGAA